MAANPPTPGSALPPGVAVVSEEWLATHETRNTQNLERIGTAEAKIHGLQAWQAEHASLAQDVQDLRQKFSKWNAWASESVGNLQKGMERLRAEMQHMQKKFSAPPPLCACPASCRAHDAISRGPALYGKKLAKCGSGPKTANSGNGNPISGGCPKNS